MEAVLASAGILRFCLLNSPASAARPVAGFRRGARVLWLFNSFCRIQQQPVAAIAVVLPVRAQKMHEVASDGGHGIPGFSSRRSKCWIVMQLTLCAAI